MSKLHVNEHSGHFYVKVAMESYKIRPRKLLSISFDTGQVDTLTEITHMTS